MHTGPPPAHRTPRHLRSAIDHGGRWQVFSTCPTSLLLRPTRKAPHMLFDGSVLVDLITPRGEGGRRLSSIDLQAQPPISEEARCGVAAPSQSAWSRAFRRTAWPPRA